MKTAIRVTVGFCFALAAMRGFAHHSFSAEFDSEKPLKLTGTVTKVEWTNPHAWFYLDVKDEKGNVANWGLELASPNALTRSGWSRSTMKAGDVVMVEGYAAKAAPNLGNARAITLTATGKTLLTSSSAGQGAR